MFTTQKKSLPYKAGISIDLRLKKTFSLARNTFLHHNCGKVLQPCIDHIFFAVAAFDFTFMSMFFIETLPVFISVYSLKRNVLLICVFGSALVVVNKHCQNYFKKTKRTKSLVKRTDAAFLPE